MERLPIDAYQKTIEETIARHPVTILTAETGAGKSTRVPMWLWKKGQIVHITQPRRIAARSLSHYVAHLNNCTLGKEVGYQTGFESKQSKTTTLLYVTDGVQMVREIKGRRDYHLLILDEVHEWNLNQEVLIGMVHKNLKNGFYRKSGKRVVIMSATLQAERLSDFFNKAPVISVPGRGYPVTMHHNDPRFLLPDTAQMVEMERNVLVFQPGKQEIDTFSDDLKRMLEAEKLKAKILPLHAELSIQDQAKVFLHYSIPKVIVATDIAQTSLTIDDIDAVVDCGIKKEIRLVRGIEGLYPVDISAAECRQRAGRAGRVRPGQYFLCADGGIEDRLPFPEPEIQRLNLETVILRLIKMGISPLDFPFFHAPSKPLIFKAIKKLKVLGALSEDEKITEDGSKMAELPVSLRGARLLLEAQKASPHVVDSALKCIAILETKGIVNKDYSGEKLTNLPYQSDLLNQLVLWQSARIYKKILSHKKMALALEIYRELVKRVQLPATKQHLTLKLKDMDLLYRAILSSFADEVYIKGGDEYLKENDIRQLDRTSILFNTRPEMLVGLPFDLIIQRENRDTGENQQMLLPLITFSSELTLEYLERLNPFSYNKNEQIFVEGGRIKIFREIFFGGRLIKAFHSAPDWQNPLEKDRVVQTVLEWYEQDEIKKRFDCTNKLSKLETDFTEIKNIVKTSLKPFEYYRKGFLLNEMRQNLAIEDLNLFFKFHSGFAHITLSQLLPHPIIRELKQAKWPQFHEVNGRLLNVCYIEKRAFLKFEYPDFEPVKEEELILPTGEWVGIILGEQQCNGWQEAIIEYNRWKKEEIFLRKFKDNPKPAHPRDIKDIPFPQPFESGRGKDNSPIEFYMVPQVQGDEVVLTHFIDKVEAEAFFNDHSAEWEAFLQQFKRSQIEDIFKQKGWKVKG